MKLPVPEWLYRDPTIDEFASDQLTSKAFERRYADVKPELHILKLLGITLPEQTTVEAIN